MRFTSLIFSAALASATAFPGEADEAANEGNVETAFQPDVPRPVLNAKPSEADIPWAAAAELEAAGLAKRSAEAQGASKNIGNFLHRGEQIVGHAGATFGSGKDDDFFKDKDDDGARDGCTGQGCFGRASEEDGKYSHDRERQHKDDTEGFEEHYWVEAINGNHNLANTVRSPPESKGIIVITISIMTTSIVISTMTTTLRLHDARYSEVPHHHEKRALAAEEVQADDVVKLAVAGDEGEYVKRQTYDEGKTPVYSDDRNERKKKSEKDDVEYYREIIGHNHDLENKGDSFQHGQQHHHHGHHQHHQGHDDYHHGHGGRKDLICIRDRCFERPKPDVVKAEE
ncbi:hypothetical protein SODALDRAFT_321117 [Sodiomyces alkalinus F11]|uniref:Uncharacterized protein n=1 Tax=Sodiomyces alkalinus (strain CBS 110278 / VKM F-3762 / F11) TaxID=1314773 RepID=A0A3N2PKJ1_SODAK|nr:hypothetical protein SODALDRAFT_321117 [Sodiomyces alkalinus F11]ROT35037.1 hypothetical protein SODALDRAFT_321117 [Sodiomyces alkalinus F11]